MVEFQVGKKGKDYYHHGTIQITVTKIEKGDPKIFDKLKNKADFKGLTPYYVFTQNKILTSEGKKDSGSPTSPIIYGALKDGTDAGKVISFGGNLGCASAYFEDSVVGSTVTKCTVTLAKSGEQVVGVKYEGDDNLYETYSANPYVKNPVVWRP